jgi:hypothetical protein
MRARILLASAVMIVAFGGTAMADFYVVQNPTTHKCSIVSQKPTSTTETVVGNTIYKTRTKAEQGMKTVKVCSDTTTGSGGSTMMIKKK